MQLEGEDTGEAVAIGVVVAAGVDVGAAGVAVAAGAGVDVAGNAVAGGTGVAVAGGTGVGLFVDMLQGLVGSADCL